MITAWRLLHPSKAYGAMYTSEVSKFAVFRLMQSEQCSLSFSWYDRIPRGNNSTHQKTLALRSKLPTWNIIQASKQVINQSSLKQFDFSASSCQCESLQGIRAISRWKALSYVGIYTVCRPVQCMKTLTSKYCKEDGKIRVRSLESPAMAAHLLGTLD